MTGIRAATRMVLLLLLAPIAAAILACSGSPLSPDLSTTAGIATPAVSANTLPWRITATVAAGPAAPSATCLAYFTTAKLTRDTSPASAAPV